MKKIISTSAMLGSLAACAGGGSGETAGVADFATVAFDAIPVTSAPLFDVISTTGVDFPGDPSLSGSTNTSINIAQDFSITVSRGGDALVSVSELDLGLPAIDDIPTFYSANGSDAVLFLKPNDFSQGGPSSGAFDYTTFGLWLDGADTNIATRTGPFEVADAGVLVVGNLSDPGVLQSVGNATYLGEALAIDADCLVVNDLLHGSVMASVDFSARQISTMIDLNRSSGQPWGVIESGDMDFSGSSVFGSPNAVADNGMTGQLHGFFAGPGGEEIAGQFHLQGEGDLQVIGSFAALADFAL